MSDPRQQLAPPPTPAGPAQQQSTFAGIVNALFNIGRGVFSLQQSVNKLLPSTSPTFAQITLNNGAAGESPLQHYQEGTWTPGVSFGGGTTGITYGTVSGTHTRIGREVTCRFSITLTSKGSSTGAAAVTGLPVQSNGDVSNTGAGGLLISYSNMSSLTAATILKVGSTSVIASLFSCGAAATSALADTNFTNTSVLAGTFTYYV